MLVFNQINLKCNGTKCQNHISLLSVHVCELHPHIVFLLLQIRHNIVTLAYCHPFIDNKTKVIFMIAFCSVLYNRSVHLFKGQFCLFIVNMFVRTEWRQDGEGADERVIMTCLQKNTWFSAGWTEELTKATEYLQLTPILGAWREFPVSHVNGRR